MSTPEQTHGIEFARAALARARAHARASMRPGWRRASSSRRGSTRWGQDPDEPVYSGARADGRDPTALGAALADLVALQGWGEPLTVAAVTGRWKQIVGPDVASHTTVEAFDVGPDAAGVAPGTPGDTAGGASAVAARIVVRADSTAWATQLRLLLPALRRRLADELATVSGLVGADVRSSWQVEVTVLAPSAPSWRKGGRHVAGRGPRDTYG